MSLSGFIAPGTHMYLIGGSINPLVVLAGSLLAHCPFLLYVFPCSLFPWQQHECEVFHFQLRGNIAQCLSAVQVKVYCFDMRDIKTLFPCDNTS